MKQLNEVIPTTGEVVVGKSSKLLEKPEPGIYMDVPADEYFRIPALNHSIIKCMQRSPAHFREAMMGVQREETEAQKLGTATHVAGLLPNVFDQIYARLPEGTKLNTAKGKAVQKQILMQKPGATTLKAEQFDLCIRMAKACWEHPIAGKLLADIQAEVVVVWRDAVLDLCKARLDGITSTGRIIDIKTTTDASLRGFARSVGDYSYHTQASFYRLGLEAHGQKPGRPIFIAVEKGQPHAVACYVIDEIGTAQAESDLYRWSEQIADCRRDNHWPSYSEKVEELALPAWALSR